MRNVTAMGAGLRVFLCGAATLAGALAIPATALAFVVSVTPDTPSKPAPGGTFNFTVTVGTPMGSNATLTTLGDNKYGGAGSPPSLDGHGTCVLPQTTFPYSCTYPGTFTGAAGGSQTNTVTAQGTSTQCFNPPTCTVTLPNVDYGTAMATVSIIAATPTPDTIPPDTIPPDTVGLTGPRKVKQGKKPSFSFDSSEAGSSFQCQLDEKPFTACTSPHQVKTGKLDPGKHSFNVVAIDPAGNTDPTPSEKRLKIQKR